MNKYLKFEQTCNSLILFSGIKIFIFNSIYFIGAFLIWYGLFRFYLNSTLTSK